jgi:hypothetical protein
MLSMMLSLGQIGASTWHPGVPDMAAIALSNTTAPEQNSTDPPKKCRLLNQGVGLQLLLHRSGELLMQGTTSIALQDDHTQPLS